MGKGSSLHAVLLLGRMNKAIARILLQEPAGSPLWEPALPAREKLCSPLQATHCTVHFCKAEVGMIQTHISVNKTSMQRRNMMICLFVLQKRAEACWYHLFFPPSFFCFGFHCHFSSVERERHSGSSCICFLYYQEENFHFPTELKVQGPAQFPSIFSDFLT